jgi:hypothetical protein
VLEQPAEQGPELQLQVIKQPIAQDIGIQMKADKLIHAVELPIKGQIKIARVFAHHHQMGLVQEFNNVLLRLQKIEILKVQDRKIHARQDLHQQIHITDRRIAGNQVQHTQDLHLPKSHRRPIADLLNVQVQVQRM